MSLSFHPVQNLPDIRAGDDLGTMLGETIKNQSITGDVLVVAQKIVSKAEDCGIELNSIEPGKMAQAYAPKASKDPRVIQAIFDQAHRIIKMEAGVIIAETHHGFVCANAGLDMSNLEEEGVILPLPEDPDQSAWRIHEKLSDILDDAPAVIISDTWGRPWREGQVNFAIGAFGLNPLRDYRGEHDTSGKELEETIIAEADELAAGAELVMRKTNKIPAVLVEGYDSPGEKGTAQTLVRDPETDFFR